MLTFKEQNKYAWVQFKITDDGGYFNNFKSYIPEDALYREENKYGMEKNPHVTVLYGLDNNVTLKDIRKTLWGAEIPKSLVGFGISEFTDDNRYDVVKLDVISPRSLWLLNDLLCSLPVPGMTYPDFKPHMTVAYVKKEWMMPKYIGDLVYPVRLYGYLEFCNNGVTEEI